MRGFILAVTFSFITPAVLPGQTDMFGWTLSASLNAGRRAMALAFSPDGSMAAVATAGGAVEVFEPGAKSPFFGAVAQHKGQTVSLAFTSDSSGVMSANDEGGIFVSLLTRAAEAAARTTRKLTSVAISRDGTLIAAAADDKSVTLWDLHSGRQIRQLQHKSKGGFIHVGFAQQDTSLIGVSRSGSICEWDVKTGAILRQIQDPDKAVHAASIGDAGNLLSIGTELADFQKGGFGQITSGFPRSSNPEPSRAGLGGGPVSGTARPTDVYRENRIKLYDLRRGTVAKVLNGINGDVVALALSPDGRFVSFVRKLIKDSFLDVYDVQRGVEVASTHVEGIGTAVAFSDQGQWLGLTTDRGDVMVWAVKGSSTPITAETLRGVIYTITSANNTPLIFPPRPQPVAVLDFNANGLDSAIGRTISDMVRTRIGEGQNVKIVERGQMEQVMREQSFQLTDRADAAVAVRLGRLLGAAKMVFGSVSKLDTRLTVNVRMVDVETGVVEGEREITCEPCVASGLQEAVIRLKNVLVK